MIPKLTCPAFPEPGSRIGENGRYFTLGRLGRGTFCSIHRCIDLSYFHSDEGSSSSSSKNKNNKRVRIVAAKVELASFSNSGVLDGEATILQHLAQTISEDVPLYLDHVRDAATQNTAIIMEYLAGRDMHQLRDMHATQRRISIADAVYLCADVLLPLLKNLHRVGVVHRDVKPSNCVATDIQKNFKLVDFGLSKSLVVPSESSLADDQHVWTGDAWHSSTSPSKGCLRKERESAEFRGTSMYASLRVHQNKDYCRRDDLWGLLYVFCDLVSGGLPWMSHAAARDRKACHAAKQDIHENHKEAQLLMGAEYHLSVHRRNEAQKKNNSKPLPPLAKPLAISKDTHKIKMLRDAFDHVASLGFVDTPNYDLIQHCLKSFQHQSSCAEEVSAQDVSSIPWNTSQIVREAKVRKSQSNQNDHDQSLWKTPILLSEESEFDPQEKLELDVWKEAELQQPLAENTQNLGGNNASTNGNSAGSSNNLNTENETGCLPLFFQYRLAQMEYNARHPTQIAPHLALRDWMACATPLLNHTSWWKVSKFERLARQRSNKDGYRRDFFKKCLQFCLDCAEPFDNFHNPEIFYVNKRQRRSMTQSNSSSSCLLQLSRTLHALRAMIDEENDKSCAPPPTISFQSNNNNKMNNNAEISPNSLPNAGG